MANSNGFDKIRSEQPLGFPKAWFKPDHSKNRSRNSSYINMIKIIFLPVLRTK